MIYYETYPLKEATTRSSDTETRSIQGGESNFPIGGSYYEATLTDMRAIAEAGFLIVSLPLNASALLGPAQSYGTSSIGLSALEKSPFYFVCTSIAKEADSSWQYWVL